VLWNELAKNDGEVGDDDHDRSVAKGNGDAVRKSGLDQVHRRLRAERLAGVDAAHDADEGDADLNGREESPRVGGQPESAVGSTAVLLGKRSQSGMSRRDNRQLR